jgi:hypothetical protein
MKLIQKYWLEFIGWASTFLILAWAWYEYGWRLAVIWGVTGVLGFMAVYWFGELMPVVGYFIRKWEREKRDGNKGR